MSPIGSRHAACVKRLNRLFSQRVGKRAIVSVQDPIRLSEHSEPQPDLALLQAHPDFYFEAHPEPQHVLLVVEVAETSVEYDREVKLPLYARAGIVEVWLVDLAAELIEIHRQPSPASYEQVRQVRGGQRLAPSISPEWELEVAEILG
jgi:Uma2 family endonuclease